jgi:ubiquinone/menaquinone biosynthesis C-methylase UbiE
VSLGKQYDKWHQNAFGSGEDHGDERSPWYQLVLEHLGSVEGKRILEVACGRGGFAHVLAARGALMFGADFSEQALEIAKSRQISGIRTHLELTQADAENLPNANQSFDVVVSCETIEHLPNPTKALREMARVCREDGVLYLTTPNYFNAMGLYYIYARLRGRRATPGSDQPFDRVFLFPQIRRMLRKAGWKIVCSDGTVHQLPILPGHNPIPLPAAESNRSIRRLLSPLAFHYFVTAQKSGAA